MRFAHISDLHLGKRLNNYQLTADQKHILEQIADIAEKESCDAVLIAGDIYDKSAPSADAVKLFDGFLTDLCRRGLSIYIISGNHDSAERVSYGRDIMERADIHICAVYNGSVHIVKAEDEYGELDICLLPFIKPSSVRAFYPDADIVTYTDMMRTALKNSDVDTNRRCVLMCHQFITGASTCDSEYISVGTLDNIDADVFDGFDYVALGHIHGPQNIAKNIRYCGTPLKYSMSETVHKKSVTIVDIKEKHDVTVSTVPLVPMHDVKQISGTYNQLMSKEYYDGLDLEDYYFITLTDDADIPNVMHKLRTVYKNIINLSFDNSRTRSVSLVTAGPRKDTATPFELFSSLYTEQNGCGLTDEQSEYIKGLIDRIWRDEV